MQAPDGQPMSAYAKAVVQERSAQIAAHYEQEATELLRRTRAQALEMISDVSDAVATGLAKDVILQRLDAIRRRVNSSDT
jgi:hypothetical protein